jgi:hypothetical protein
MAQLSGCGMANPPWHRVQASFAPWHALQEAWSDSGVFPWLVPKSAAWCDFGALPPWHLLHQSTLWQIWQLAGLATACAGWSASQPEPCGREIPPWQSLQKEGLLWHVEQAAELLLAALPWPVRVRQSAAWWLCGLVTEWHDAQ